MTPKSLLQIGGGALTLTMTLSILIGKQSSGPTTERRRTPRRPTGGARYSGGRRGAPSCGPSGPLMEIMGKRGGVGRPFPSTLRANPPLEDAPLPKRGLTLRRLLNGHARRAHPIFTIEPQNSWSSNDGRLFFRLASCCQKNFRNMSPQF